MPLPNLPVPQFPNVPAVPGVPALVRIAGAPVIASVNALLTKVGLGQFAFGLDQPVWGIFDDQNNPVAISDSVGAFEFRSDSHSADYPMEAGAFASYNKVQLPFEARMRLHRGGAVEDRQAFLQALELAKNSTNLYTIVTPEASYFNISIDRYDYRRETRDGATLLTVDVGLKKIRQAPAAQYSQAAGSTQTTDSPPLAADQVQSPSAADPVSQGQVQATAPTPSQDATTNFVSDSANDATQPQSGTIGDLLAANAPANAGPSAADNLAAYQDRLNNPPPGYSETQFATYKTGLATRYGITTTS